MLAATPRWAISVGVAVVLLALVACGAPAAISEERAIEQYTSWVCDSAPPPSEFVIAERLEEGNGWRLIDTLFDMEVLSLDAGGIRTVTPTSAAIARYRTANDC